MLELADMLLHGIDFKSTALDFCLIRSAGCLEFADTRRPVEVDPDAANYIEATNPLALEGPIQVPTVHAGGFPQITLTQLLNCKFSTQTSHAAAAKATIS